MAERDLMNAFADCIERMEAGESMESCLQDYPDRATYLQQMLQTVDLVYRAHEANGEANAAQERGRSRVIEAMQDRSIGGQNKKKKHTPKTKRNRRSWFIPLASAATIALFVGIGMLIALQGGSYSAEIDPKRTSIAVLYTTTEAQINMTRSVDEALATSTMKALTTPEPGIKATQLIPPSTPTGTPAPTMTALPTIMPASTEFDVIPTSVASMPEMTPMPETGGGGSTGGGEPSLSTESGSLDGDDKIPGRDPDESGLGDAATSEEPDPLAHANMTATSLALIFNTPTPAGTSAPADTSVGAGGGIPEDREGDVFAATPTFPLPKITPTPDIPGEDAFSLTATAVNYMVQVTRTAMAEISLTSTPAPTISTIPGTPAPLPQLIPLNAGEIDDNAEWESYLTYREAFALRGIFVHDVDVSERLIISVTDEQGLPLLGVKVSVYDGSTLLSETRTYATGKTLFFPSQYPQAQNAQSFRVVLEKDDRSAEYSLPRAQQVETTFVLPNMVVDRQNAKLDVLFLLDATGSMADEIAQIQNNILWISSQMDALPGNVDVRYGLVTYRDFGDAYITRVHQFVSDVGEFQNSLNRVRAEGGGDTPESMNQALHDALWNVEWRGDDTVKLVFLVADAPPHLDYPNDTSYAAEMMVAAQNGIKIHPLASSGLDNQGEYIFRQIAQYTMGHFLFLTYDSGTSGTTGESRPDLDVGEPESVDPEGGYTVDRLDDLVLQLITDELAAFRGE